MASKTKTNEMTTLRFNYKSFVCTSSWNDRDDNAWCGMQNVSDYLQTIKESTSNVLSL